MSLSQLGSEPTRTYVALGSLIYNTVGSMAASLGLVIDYYFYHDLSGSGVFTLNGVPLADGGLGYVGSGDIRALGFYTGATPGMNKLLVQPVFRTTVTGTVTDEYWIDVVSSGVPNQAPTLSGPATLTMFRNASLAFSDVFASGTFSAQDPDGYVVSYRFTDTQPGAGSLRFFGLEMWATSLTVQKDQLDKVIYQSTGTLGTNDITIEAIDAEGKSSTPLKLTVNVVNQLPVVTGPSTTITVNTFDTISIDKLVSASDPDGSVVDYFITNDSGTDYFTFAGATQPKPSFEFMYMELQQALLYHAGSTAGSDTFTVKVMDNDYGYSQVLTVTVNVANRPPVVTGPTSVSMGAGQIYELGSLIGGSDPDGTVLGYRFADTTLGEAYLTNDGVKITPHPTEGAWFVVWAADLSKVGYYTGTSTGSNTIEINAIDNLGLSSATLSMTINTEPNTAPTISGPAKVSTGINQSFGFNSGAAMITATDVDGAIAQYRFTDSMAGAGNLTLNGMVAPSVFTVSAANLGQVGYSTGSLAGSNVIAIEAIDSAGAPSPAVLLMTVNVGAGNEAPTISGPSSVSKGINESFTFGTTAATGVVVLKAGDTDGSVAQYLFTDTEPGAGYLTLGGSPIDGTSVTVTAANLGTVGYITGPSLGSNAIEIQSIDNLGASSSVLAMTVFAGTSGGINQAPTISGPGTVTKGVNESFTFGTTVAPGVVVLGATDADGTVAQYRFSDNTPGAGYLTHKGEQITGTSVTVSAANLGEVGYQTGAVAGSNSIVIEAIDNLGLASPNLLAMTISVSSAAGTGNQAPTISGPASVSKGLNETFTFGTTAGTGVVVLGAADADGTVTQYRFSDNTPGAGWLTWDDAPITGTSITVDAADLSKVGYRTGTSAGSNSIAIEAIDNLGLASTGLLTMLVNVGATTGTGNQGPTITGPAGVSKGINETFAFTSLISATDADGTVAQYRFSDNSAGAGYLKLNGMPAPSVFTVAAADLAQVTYYTGLSAGSNAIAIEAIDNLGMASPGVLTMSISVGGSGGSANLAPTITGPASISRGVNESFTFSSLISAADADGTVAQYRFSDSIPGAGYLTLNGVQIAGTSFTVSATNLGEVGYFTGGFAGSNSIAIEAIDNLGLASPGFMTLSISVADASGIGGTGGSAGSPNLAPTITGVSSVSKAVNESFTFASLISASDADGTVAQYRFSDSIPGAGHLTLNGAQIAGTSLTVSAADLGQVGYFTGASAGSNSIAIEAIDDLGRASPGLVTMSINVAATAGTSGGGGTTGSFNLAPTITGPATVSKGTNESFTFTSLISAADADGTVAQYRFSDTMSGAGTLTLNGAAAPSVFTVASADLAQVGYSTGTSAGSNTIVIEAVDNLGKASPGVLAMSINVSSTASTGGTAGAVNKPPTISGPASVSQAANQSFTFTSLISASDADGSVAQYRFSDSFAGAGYLTLNGVAAPSVFTVTAANLGQVGYFTGLSSGSNTIAIEAIDNLGLASPGVLLMNIDVAAAGLSSTGSNSGTVISSNGIGEAPLMGAGGLLTAEAGAFTAANVWLHASGTDGVLSDLASGAVKYTFSHYSEFLFNGGALNDIIKVGELAGTVIGNHSLYLNGNDGNDLLDGSATDTVIVVNGGSGDDRIFGSSRNDILSGDAGDDQLSGGKGDDVVRGGEGADTFSAILGRDIVNGGAGDDVLEVTGLTNYTVTGLRANSFLLSDVMGNLAIVRDVEHIQLAGSGPVPVSSRVGSDPLDERLVELYVAAFNRAPETEGYDFWLDMEAKEGLARVADTIFSLPIVKAIYADTMSASQFVTSIYENVFDRAPDAEGLDFWVDLLGSTSRGNLVLTMTSAALGVADGTEGKAFLENRVDWAMFAMRYQEATKTDLAPEYLHQLTDSVSADAASLVTLVGQFATTMP